MLVTKGTWESINRMLKCLCAIWGHVHNRRPKRKKSWLDTDRHWTHKTNSCVAAEFCLKSSGTTDLYSPVTSCFWSFVLCVPPPSQGKHREVCSLSSCSLIQSRFGGYSVVSVTHLPPLCCRQAGSCRLKNTPLPYTGKIKLEGFVYISPSACQERCAGWRSMLWWLSSC